MQANESSRQKSAVEQLTFGQKTSKRVSWESWEFTVIGPHLVRVTNASYGFLKDDHSYTVGVEECDGLAVPAECDCPADKYREEYDCKHKVALAAIGGPTVLNAAVEFSPRSESSEDAEPEPTTAADKLRADGGNPHQQEGDDECACTPDFPCAECYISGKREFTE